MQTRLEQKCPKRSEDIHGSVFPLVKGDLFLLNTKDNLLVFQKAIYGIGSTVDSALKDFTNNIAKEFSEVMKG